MCDGVFPVINSGTEKVLRGILFAEIKNHDNI